MIGLPVGPNCGGETGFPVLVLGHGSCLSAVRKVAVPMPSALISPKRLTAIPTISTFLNLIIRVRYVGIQGSGNSAESPLQEEKHHGQNSGPHHERREAIVRKKHTMLKIGLVGVAATLLPLIGAGTAFSDNAPQSLLQVSTTPID